MKFLVSFAPSVAGIGLWLGVSGILTAVELPTTLEPVLRIVSMPSTDVCEFTITETVREIHTRVTTVQVEREKSAYKLTPNGPRLIKVKFIEDQQVEYNVDFDRVVKRKVKVPIDRVEAYGRNGVSITAETLRQRLAEPTAVLLSRDQSVVDPAFLTLLSDDAMLLVVDYSFDPPEQVEGPPVPEPTERLDGEKKR